MKFFHVLAAGGLLLLSSACTVVPSPTRPTALIMVDAPAVSRFEPAIDFAKLAGILDLDSQMFDPRPGIAARNG